MEEARGQHGGTKRPVTSGGDGVPGESTEGHRRRGTVGLYVPVVGVFPMKEDAGASVHSDLHSRTRHLRFENFAKRRKTKSVRAHCESRRSAMMLQRGAAHDPVGKTEGQTDR